MAEALKQLRMPNNDVVNIPSEWDDNRIRGFIEEKFPGVWDREAEKETLGSKAQDALLSYGGGVEKSAIGLAGLPGTVEGLGKGGLGLMGIDTPPQAFPDAGQLQSSYEQLRGRPIYEPQTSWGEVTQPLGEMATGAIGGIEGALGRVATNVVAPAFGSYLGGKAAEWVDPELKPIGQGVGGLLGFGTGAGVKAARIPKAAGLPMASEIDTMAEEAIKRAEDANVHVTRKSVSKFAEDLQSQSANMPAISKVRHKNAASIVKDLQKKVMPDASGNFLETVSLRELYEMRKDIATVAASSDASERRIGVILKNKMDDYLDQLKPTDVTNGNSRAGVDSLKEFRQLYSRARKTEVVEDLFKKAEMTANTNYNQAGQQTAIKRAFKELALNKRKMRQFTPAEKDAIETVANGGPIEDFMRRVGKLAPLSVGPALLSLGIGHEFGGEAAAAFGGATGTARWLSGRETGRNAQKAYDLIRGGGPIETPKGQGFGTKIGTGSGISLPFRLPDLKDRGISQADELWLRNQMVAEEEERKRREGQP